MENFYWAVYKRIEEEVIKLSYDILFTDKQVDVFSVKIADLIIRCSIEVESISKDIYLSNGGDAILKKKRELKEIYTLIPIV